MPEGSALLRFFVVVAGITIAAASGAEAQSLPTKLSQAAWSALCVVDAAPADPFEGVNRELYAIHDGLDHAVLGPVASGYVRIVPSPLRAGLHNFFGNLGEVGVFANDALQFKPKRAALTAARFVTNSTIGVAGVFDPATGFGLAHHDNDFGVTLGHLGIGPGPYLFVPLAGPTDFRDLIGSIVDIAFQPLTWTRFDGDDAVRATGVVTTGLQQRADAGPQLEALGSTSLDPYASLRSVYLQNRQGLVNGGVMSMDSLPDFDDPSAPESSGDTPSSTAPPPQSPQ